MKKKIAILGSTGSIGINTLEIIKKDPMIKNNIVEWKLNEWININQ